jgi:ppGpp synthetase/RelA/SpoT-type nucleotidyltranferase
MGKKGAPKPSFAEYPSWHLKAFAEDLRAKNTRQAYELNSNLAIGALDKHEFTSKLTDSLAELHEKRLFAIEPQIVFRSKPYDSVVDKTFRLNCHWNRRFPKEPPGGWYKAENWFGRIDDLIRTLLVCRYIDGPETICREIERIAKVCNLSSSYEPRATNQGYYAYHSQIMIPIDIFVGGQPQNVHIKLEIQVTTQLQEILRDLTHLYYRQRRVTDQPNRIAANWDYTSNSFRASYLGHTLHLIEGMIVSLRDEANALNVLAPIVSNETSDEPADAQPKDKEQQDG